MFTVAMWGLAIAACGIAFVALRVTKQASKHFAKEARAAIKRSRWNTAWAEHHSFHYSEEATLAECPYASGRTKTDSDGVVHIVPLGCNTITVCWYEIVPEDLLRERFEDRYVYDPPGRMVTCMACLGGIQAC